MQGNLHVPFLGGWAGAIPPGYPAREETCRKVTRLAPTQLESETSGRQGNKRAWLGVAVTSWVTVFVVRMSRGGPRVRARLGETCTGLLVTDRYRAYNGYPVWWRQVCWAHVLRDFEAMRGRGGRSEAMGGAFRARRTRG
jgi:transposase